MFLLLTMCFVFVCRLATAARQIATRPFLFSATFLFSLQHRNLFGMLFSVVICLHLPSFFLLPTECLANRLFPSLLVLPLHIPFDLAAP